MQCEYDPEKMIEEIKKRPGIWDFEDPSYRSKETRHKLWQEVVKELVTGVSCSKSELRELEIQLQKKWKSIRDCFHKHQTKPNYTKRPYIYTKQLQFLKKAIKINRSSQGQSSQDDAAAESDSDEGQKSKWKSKHKLKLIKNEDSSDDDNAGDNFQEAPVYYEFNDADENPTQPAKLAKNSRAPEEFAFASVDNSDDCDRMFLLSLLPHLKAIPEEFRMDAKIELMQIIRNAKARRSNGHSSFI